MDSSHAAMRDEGAGMICHCLNCRKDYDIDTQGTVCPHESGERRRDSTPPFPKSDTPQHDLSTREGCFEAFLEQKRRSEALEAENVTLKATVQRLSGPVKPRENTVIDFEGEMAYLDELAARATPPAKEDSDAHS